jgi:isopentenyl diphosphate isomerase/L-lactate dehydrogenase-like FMN-dependent dehydrogenase
MDPLKKQHVAELFRSIILHANEGMKTVNKKGDVDTDALRDILNDVESDYYAVKEAVWPEEVQEET